MSIQHLQDLEHEIRDRHDQGLFDEEFFQERLTFYSFRLPDDFPAARSLIVIAMPSPQTRATFTSNGKTVSLILPPTYWNYDVIPQQLEDLLTEWLASDGYRVALAKLPLKPLAVRSGLGKYGRNNICYVKGMGSFIQLAAFYSNLPCKEDHWHEPCMMDRCQKCDACLKKCPTKAIPSDRFLLRAERCIVFHNEKPAGIPLPGWISPASYNCLIGCMDCQKYCPENKKFLKWIKAEEVFSQDETTLLLEGVLADQLPAETVNKLERLDLMDSLDILPRNLSVFFNVGITAH